MVDVMSVKQEGTQELLACRICLATDTALYNIGEAELNETFQALMGTEDAVQVWCCGLRLVCGSCGAQLSRAAALRARCLRAEKLLATALQQHYMTIDYIRTIDRVAEKLCLNLKTCNVYSSDSTQQEVKLEDVKEEADGFTENIFISEPILDDSCVADTPELEHNKIEETTQDDCIENNITKTKINNRITESTRRKRKLPKSTKKPKKLPESTKKTKKLPTSTKKTKKLPESTKSTKLPEKRVIKRRMADNGFLPDFDFDEFESKYNVKIDILSREEQLREVEARKMAASYCLAAYGCEECGKAFASKQVYDAHVVKHDPAAGAHACGVCGLRFRTRSRAHVHGDAHRLRFTCAACGFLTRTRFIAKNHYLSHAGSTHQCPHCEASFTKYTSYLTHVRRRHPAMNVACDECGETFVGSNGLRHHKTRVHRNGTVSASGGACACGAGGCGARHKAGGQCDESADTCACAARARHCPECDTTFVDAASFDTHHRRVHLLERAAERPRERGGGRGERGERAGGGGLICELCGANCTSVSSLAAHQRAHSGARAHACPAAGCARRFSTRHNMRRHHRVVHLGQRPLVSCGLCGKQLAHAASLKLHVRTVHLRLPAPPRPPLRPPRPSARRDH